MRRTSITALIVAGAALSAAGQAPPSPPAVPSAAAPAEGVPAAAPGAPVDAPVAATATELDLPARIYINRCTGCHTIGRGNLTGPDLLPSTGWPDADLRVAIVKMQEKAGPLATEELGGLVELLKSADVAARLAAEEARIALQYAATLEPPSPRAGERLFFGETPLQNGGLACVACHRVGDGAGGLLGPDLAGIFSRTGETGLRSACEKAQFKVMSAAYRDRPVTRQEAIHLTAWFERAEQAPPVGSPPPFAFAGAVLAAALFALTLFALRHRHRGARAVLARRSS